MKTQHTPGPWKSDNYLTKMEFGDVTCIQTTETILNGGLVAVCHGKNSLANARLIAAAPEMLEALAYTLPHIQEYVEYHEKRGGSSVEMITAMELMQAAIAKAKGGK